MSSSFIKNTKFLSFLEINYWKGVFDKNEMGYRLTAQNNHFWSLLILLLSVSSLRKKNCLKQPVSQTVESMQIEIPVVCCNSLNLYGLYLIWYESFFKNVLLIDATDRRLIAIKSDYCSRRKPKSLYFFANTPFNGTIFN